MKSTVVDESLSTNATRVLFQRKNTLLLQFSLQATKIIATHSAYQLAFHVQFHKISMSFNFNNYHHIIFICSSFHLIPRIILLSFLWLLLQFLIPNTDRTFHYINFKNHLLKLSIPNHLSKVTLSMPFNIKIIISIPFHNHISSNVYNTTPAENPPNTCLMTQQTTNNSAMSCLQRETIFT